jgi:hypothetical protein
MESSFMYNNNEAEYNNCDEEYDDYNEEDNESERSNEEMSCDEYGEGMKFIILNYKI